MKLCSKAANFQISKIKVLVAKESCQLLKRIGNGSISVLAKFQYQ